MDYLARGNCPDLVPGFATLSDTATFGIGTFSSHGGYLASKDALATIYARSCKRITEKEQAC